MRRQFFRASRCASAGPFCILPAIGLCLGHFRRTPWRLDPFWKSSIRDKPGSARAAYPFHAPRLDDSGGFCNGVLDFPAHRASASATGLCCGWNFALERKPAYERCRCLDGASCPGSIHSTLWRRSLHGVALFAAPAKCKRSALRSGAAQTALLTAPCS